MLITSFSSVFASKIGICTKWTCPTKTMMAAMINWNNSREWGEDGTKSSRKAIKNSKTEAAAKLPSSRESQIT